MCPRYLHVLTTRLQGSRHRRLKGTLGFLQRHGAIFRDSLRPQPAKACLGQYSTPYSAGYVRGLRCRPVVERKATPIFSRIYYDMNLCHSLIVLSHQLMYRTPIHGSYTWLEYWKAIFFKPLSSCLDVSLAAERIQSIVFHTAVSC